MLKQAHNAEKVVQLVTIRQLKKTELIKCTYESQKENRRKQEKTKFCDKHKAGEFPRN